MLTVTGDIVAASVQGPQNFVADISAIAGLQIRRRKDSPWMRRGRRKMEAQAYLATATPSYGHTVGQAGIIWRRVFVTVAMERIGVLTS